MTVLEKIKQLTGQLLPTGRAFRLFGWGDLLNDALV